MKIFVVVSYPPQYFNIENTEGVEYDHKNFKERIYY